MRQFAHGAELFLTMAIVQTFLIEYANNSMALCGVEFFAFYSNDQRFIYR